ncbi:hypothetical protein [Gemella haemolysans]|uniref:hypothetical protein n=1 Tax=Gemella haemolysans TaxID=1379 RepID=UPI001956FE1B|nr:hypothetical protein [Gemella haemolysans]VTX66901.1 Uncharacterised protein [Gemella haemolysans]
MLTFKLISIVDGFYHYEIYPEKKIENKQILIFNPQSKEVKENTFDNFNIKYLMQFLQGFTDVTGNFKKEGMVAWG